MNGPAEREPLPWRLQHLLLLYAALAVAALVMLASWFGASGTTKLSTQIVWLNVGAAGVVLAGTAIALWLMVGRRAVGLRVQGLIGRLAAPPVEARRDSARLVAGPRMTRYHREDCPLVQGKRVRPASAAQHQRAGRLPCGVCAP
jgi:hypothetical protein